MLYFNPATVKMLSNLKVLVLAILLKIVMKRRFFIIQSEALALLLIGISLNQFRNLPEGVTSLTVPVATSAYLYTLIFITVPSMASFFNEYAMKSQYDTSIYLEATYVTSIARSHAHDHNLHEGTVIGSFNGEFWGMFAGHQGYIGERDVCCL